MEITESAQTKNGQRIYKGHQAEWTEGQVSHRRCVSKLMQDKDFDTRVEARHYMCAVSKACSKGIKVEEALKECKAKKNFDKPKDD